MGDVGAMGDVGTIDDMGAIGVDPIVLAWG
jgi:hypothetical protein